MELPLIVSILLTLAGIFGICMGVPLALRLDEKLPQTSLLWMGLSYFVFAVWVMLCGGLIALAWGGLS